MDKWLKRWIAFKRVLRQCDVVLQVVDARDPWGTLNWSLKRYISKMIVVVSKSDLVPPERLGILPRLLHKYRWVAVSSSTGEGIAMLRNEIRKACERRPIRTAVIGYPNVGKSSLMNRLARRKATKVSPVPGQTTNVQWVTLGDILLYDTPGVVPPSETGVSLVLKSAVAAQKIPSPEPIALEIIAKNMEAVCVHYDVPMRKTDDAEKILIKIAKRRGRMFKGGEPDVDTVARLIINDFQRGRLRL